MGLTVVDTAVLIGLLDARDAHHAVASDAVAEARERGDAVLLPASALAELLVLPARRGRGRPHPEAVVDAVLGFCDEYPVEVVPLDVDIAVRAAHLRAEHGPGLRLPDALVVATAVARGADVLVTTDHRWPTAAFLGLAGRLHVLERPAPDRAPTR